MSNLPPEDLPDLRDVLTTDGRELPPIRLTDRQWAELGRIVRWDDDPIHTCTCGHDIDDHRPVTDEWPVGGRMVSETREECAECECPNFEEDPNA